ncbi:MAG: hypothetical protein WA152_01845 [Microgenomates group bacterium]
MNFELWRLVVALMLGTGLVLSIDKVADAISAVAKAMEERNRIEKKKMELQGLEAKKKGVSEHDTDMIVQRPY